MSILSINESQVIKFYQQREINKKRHLPMPPIAQSHDLQHAFSKKLTPFNNLYRKKILANRMKEDSSLFTSFNDYIEEEKPFKNCKPEHSTPNLKRKITLKEGESSNLIQDFKNNSGQNFFLNEIVIEPSNIQQQNFSGKLMNRLKKRSNSLHLENKSIQFQNLKKLKGTIPLSTILKKYKEQVDKIDDQNMTLNLKNPILCNQISIVQKLHQQSNKENFHNLQLVNQQIKATGGSKQNNELPLEIQSLIKKYDTNSYFPQKKNKETQEILSRQVSNEQDLQIKLQNKQQHISNLERELIHYKKFVKSIQKMKNTLEQMQNKDKALKHWENNRQNTKPKQQIDNQKQNNKSQHQQKQFLQQFNLKQLWRWIKSLPAKTQSKKQTLR